MESFFIFRYNFNLNDLKDIQVLLKKAPNLREIELKSCELIGLDQTIQYPHLQTINLQRVSSLDDSLTHLMENSPNLKGIHYQDCDLEAHFSNLRPSVIAELTSLTLDTHISAEEAAFLLENTPNLKTLNLNKQNLESVLNLLKPETRLNALEHLELDVAFNKLNESTLKKLLILAPNLENKNRLRFYLKSIIDSRQSKQSLQSIGTKNELEDKTDQMRMCLSWQRLKISCMGYKAAFV